VGDDAEVTTGVHTYRADGFDAATLAGAKRGRSVSVCIPARDEAATVGTIVAAIRRGLSVAAGGVDLVDEVLVVDDGSRDATAVVAAAAGARVATTGGRGAGKGEAMRMALTASRGDVLVFVDADVTNFTPRFVTGLLGPVLTDDDVALVKGCYARPLHGRVGEGGRVTELVARPVIDLLFPHLAGVAQPLAGETAAPRTVLDKVTLAPGYGVELALLIDVVERFGIDAVAQVDLGTRVHRNRPLAELRPQARDVLRAALERAAVPVTPAPSPGGRPGSTGAAPGTPGGPVVPGRGGRG
jgi:glucosyl-3-phosphoglycerate synthase